MPLSTGALVVFALIGVALVLFVTEWVTSDIVALGVLVTLAALSPLTGIDADEAIRGFASPATVTILAMYILSAGVEKTGIIQRLGLFLAEVTGGDEGKLLGAVVATAGLSAGFVNNTPVVAVFIPMVQGLADRIGVSPSKLLLPLSYAAMLGGTLTLVGTATNVLASDLSDELLDHPFSMFEITPLGLLVLSVGSVYLLTVGHRLVPARIAASADPTRSYEVQDHLARVRVRDDSPLVGRRVSDVFIGEERDVDLLQLRRGPETYLALIMDTTIEPRDTLVVRHGDGILDDLIADYRVKHLSAADVDINDLNARADRGTIVEAVVPSESSLCRRPLKEIRLPNRYDTRVLSVRRGSDLIAQGLPDLTLKPGDTLLLQSTDFAIDHFRETDDLVFTDGVDQGFLDGETELSPKTPVALAILAAVILLAAVGVLDIVIAALAGVVAMVVTGCLRPNEAYDSVSWDVIFLLAGILPLGFAMQETGGAAFIADQLSAFGGVVPVAVLLGAFYLLTGLLANLITPVASLVLMAPIAVDTARSVGGEGFSFLLAVTFAASSAFMTPIGYQTNLMVYGPGGYRFTDYLRVGAPLQLLLTVVVTGGIALIWGI